MLFARRANIRRSLSETFNGHVKSREALLPTGYGTLSGIFTIFAKADQRGLFRSGWATGH